MVNERNETMKNVAKFIAVALLALVCGGFAGCSDDVEYQLSENWINAEVVGFIDDSLVMVEDYRYWYEFRESWNGAYSEDSGCENTRLCVYNYRVQEDGPRSCDTSIGYAGYSGQLTDSVVWYGIFGSRSSLQLWKVGENGRKHYSLDVVNDGCGVGFDGARAHEWLDGKFIVIGKQSLSAGNDSCQYAVLDTTKRTLTYKRLDENLKWIQKCDDVRAWGEDVYCLQTFPNADQIGHLLVNGVDQGMLKINAAIGPFWGNMLELGNNLCELSDEGMLKCLSVRWLGGTEKAKFVDENGNTIYLGE